MKSFCAVTALLAALLLQLSQDATAQSLSGSTNVGIPASVFMLSDQSACPSGWTEVTTYQGRYPVLIAASGSAADTLGSAIATTTTDLSYTPGGTNGTVAITPLGSNAAITAGTPAGTNGTSLLTLSGGNTAVGTAATVVLASAANATVGAQTFTGSQLSTHNHTFTGSSTTVGAETFTGTANTTLRSTVAPSVAFRLCKRT